jgi:hypothetical protein
MQNKSVILMIGAECPPELDEKFNKWYNEKHIPIELKAEGILGITRYKLSSVKVDQQEYPAYLAIYEFENINALHEFWSGPVLAAAREEMKETWADRMFDLKWRVVYEPIWTSYE